MEDEIADHDALRREIREKYRDVAIDPDRGFDFYTGRPLAARLGYPASVVDALPERAVESFAGVSNPFSLRRLKRGERIVDVGSGAGFDAFVAAGQVGDMGRVIGIDMTPEMVARSRAKRRGARIEAGRVSRGPGGSPARRRRLGRCSHLERRDQSLRRQDDSVRRDLPRAATRRSAPIRRRRQRAPGAARGSPRY